MRISSKSFAPPIPRRDDKLANSIENLGFGEAAWALRRLYDLRKKADYSVEEVTENEAWKAFEVYGEARRILERWSRSGERVVGDADSC